MNRRHMITNVLAAAAAGSLGSTLLTAQGGMGMGRGMGMGAPAQKAPVPPTPIDPEPHVNDIEKYPRCAYCNMDRKRFHFSRMLISYEDGTVDGLCSIRCAMTSLTMNMSKGPKGFWVGDNASTAEIKPLIDAQTATYVVGGSLPSVMSKRSKTAFSSVDAAEAATAANGGDVVTFDKALVAAYADVAESVAANLKKRRETAKGGGAAAR